MKKCGPSVPCRGPDPRGILPRFHEPAMSRISASVLSGISAALRWGVVLLLTLCTTAVSACPPADPLAQVLALPTASLLVEEKGKAVIAHQVDRPMIPASTLKLLTALASIQRWGLEHRFHTDFFLADDGWLWVKGYGDPFLVSEELDRIVTGLKAHGVRKLAGVATDDTYFAPDVEVAGRSSSDNPYDAPVAALAANFNTINVLVTAHGVESAEPQTPLTALARSLGRGLAPGKQRINLGERKVAARYFGELLAAKLAAAGVEVTAAWRDGEVPAGAKRLYRHENSRDLRAVIASMLEFSSNFSANQLFLLLGERGDEKTPLTMEASRRAMSAWIDKTFGWKDYRIEEGSGLSRNNRLSARQLLEAVKAFAPYRDLLPSKEAGVHAKTGTLTGVSSYAGYVERRGVWIPFSLLINQSVPYGLRQDVAQALVRQPDLALYCRGSGC